MIITPLLYPRPQLWLQLKLGLREVKIKGVCDNPSSDFSSQTLGAALPGLPPPHHNPPSMRSNQMGETKTSGEFARSPPH